MVLYLCYGGEIKEEDRVAPDDIVQARKRRRPQFVGQAVPTRTEEEASMISMRKQALRSHKEFSDSMKSESRMAAVAFRRSLKSMFSPK